MTTMSKSRWSTKSNNLKNLKSKETRLRSGYKSCKSNLCRGGVLILFPLLLTAYRIDFSPFFHQLSSLISTVFYSHGLMSQVGLALYPPLWNRQNNPSFLGLRWGWDEICGLREPLAFCNRSVWWLWCSCKSRFGFLLRILKRARNNALYGSNEAFHCPVHKYTLSSFMAWIVVCLPLARHTWTKLISVLYWSHTPMASCCPCWFDCSSQRGIGRRKRLCIANGDNRRRTLWRNCCNVNSVLSMSYI